MTNPFTSQDDYRETDNDKLTDLLLSLDAVQPWLVFLQGHFDGNPPIQFISDEAREGLTGVDALYINVPRIVVGSIAERLYVNGFTGADADLAERIWYDNNLDIESDLAHAEALLYGRSYAAPWVGSDGAARISIESARQVSVAADPGTREIVSGAKRWYTQQGQGLGSTRAVMWLPDRIEEYAANAGAATGGFQLQSVIPNPLGCPPIVQFSNQGRLLTSWGNRGLDEISFPARLLLNVASEIQDVVGLASALSKLCWDMMISSEYTGLPRRYASGIQPVERPRVDCEGEPVIDPTTGEQFVDVVNPLAEEKSRTWVAEAEGARFGQIQAGDLSQFTDAVNVIVQQIIAVTALTPGALGVLSAQPPSADALRAQELSLVSKVEQRQRMFGRSWERTLKLGIAAETGRDPRSVDVRVAWRPADQSSLAQASDATTKLFAAGLLPQSSALRLLGFSDEQIDQIRQDMTDDTVAQKRGDPMSQYLNRSNPQLGG
jgi:hypothetical protein